MEAQNRKLEFEREIDRQEIAYLEPEIAKKSLGQLMESVSEYGNPTKRLAYYFLEALSSRIFKKPARVPLALDSCWKEFVVSHRAFYHACPYLKFGFLASNHAILEASKNSPTIHIIGSWHSMGGTFTGSGRPTRRKTRECKDNLHSICSYGKEPCTLLLGTRKHLFDFAKNF
ncbi:hypothetical protein DM860_005014 [Cuscuta australis]|uniref:Uncharacterized protein n=1 Tax=Cuscuta australis TaxID=267555 RepID=A0A328DM45_9ASTE|nr:hypothetical protein DM860_005014 [Cuscuta australis]